MVDNESTKIKAGNEKKTSNVQPRAHGRRNLQRWNRPAGVVSFDKSLGIRGRTATPRFPALAIDRSSVGGVLATCARSNHLLINLIESPKSPPRGAQPPHWINPCPPSRYTHFSSILHKKKEPIVRRGPRLRLSGEEIAVRRGGAFARPDKDARIGRGGGGEASKLGMWQWQ